MIRVGVVVFPGSNCEHDAVEAVRLLGGDADLIWHGDRSVDGFEAVILPGGFAHGDYLRTGAIARPGNALGTGVRGGSSVGGDDADLPRLAALVLGERCVDRLAWPEPPLEQAEDARPIGADSGRLGRDRPDTRQEFLSAIGFGSFARAAGSL